MAIKTRWWIRRDMPEVLRIEKDVFGALAHSEAEFLKLLRERNVIAMVAEDVDEIVGYMIYELHKKKLHLLHLVVKPTRQGQGIGSKLVQKLVSKLSADRRTAITLEIRETLVKAQLFFKEKGFFAHDVIRDYFPGTHEDAYYMSFSLTEKEKAQK